MEERKSKQKSDPIFKERGDGLYLVVPIRGRIFAFVPRFGLEFESFHHGPYDMGHVFDCKDYKEDMIFSRIFVEMVAFFEFIPSNQTFNLVQSGRIRLDLGQKKSERANGESKDTFFQKLLDLLRYALTKSTIGTPVYINKFYDFCIYAEFGEFDVRQFRELANLCKRNLLRMVEDGKLPLRSRSEKEQFLMNFDRLVGIIERSRIISIHYNEVLRNAAEFDKFRKLYRIEFMGVANAEKRKKDISIEPLFDSRTDGAYMAIQLNNEIYAVVPRIGIPINWETIGPYFMGKIFKCKGYNAGRIHAVSKIEKTAFFEYKDNLWKFLQSGVLQLMLVEQKRTPLIRRLPIRIPKISLRQYLKNPKLMLQLRKLRKLHEKIKKKRTIYADSTELEGMERHVKDLISFIEKISVILQQPERAQQVEYDPLLTEQMRACIRHFRITENKTTLIGESITILKSSREQIEKDLGKFRQF